MMGPEVADAARRISAQLKAAWYRLTIPPFSPSAPARPLGFFRQSPPVVRLPPAPAPRPTDLAFGGPELDQLYMTTARQPVSLDALANAPWSGGCLRWK